MGEGPFGDIYFDRIDSRDFGLPKSAILKLELAQLRIDELRIRQIRFVAEGHLEATRQLVEPDADGRSRIHQVLWSRREPVPAIIGLLVGEVAHSIRCALDHLAFALAQAGAALSGVTLSPDHERNVQFPVCDSDAQFWKAARRRLPFVEDRLIEWIRCRQPYNAMKVIPNQHPLSIVSRLDNVDKHRRINVVSDALVMFRDNWDSGLPEWRWTPATTPENAAIGQYEFDFPVSAEHTALAFDYGLFIDGIPRQGGKSWEVLQNCLAVTRGMVMAPLTAPYSSM